MIFEKLSRLSVEAKAASSSTQERRFSSWEGEAGMVKN